MPAELVQTDRLQQNGENNVSEADQLKINPDTRQTPGLLRRLARPAIMMSLLPAVLGSVSPATADAHKAPHRKATHKHHKTAPPTTETPIQKATSTTIQNIAAQIIADYNQIKGNPQFQGVGYVPEHAPAGPGEQVFNVEYPTGTNTIVNNGTTENIGTGGYRLEASISYPPTDKNPPSKINLNNVSGVTIYESLDATGFGANYFSPYSSFSAEGNSTSSTKNQWDLFQEISAVQPAGTDDWAYVAGTGSLNQGNKTTSYAPLTMPELRVMADEAQAALNNAKQYVVPSITPALEAPLGPPTRHLPPLPPPR